MPTSQHMSVYCLYLLMPIGLFALIQRFPRQATEDGSDPSATWGPDRVEADAEDPDDDDNVPIPLAVPGPATGKTRASSLRDWSEDEDDDCQILEVHDAIPVAFAYPVRSPSADSDDQVQEVDPPAVGFTRRNLKVTGLKFSTAKKGKKRKWLAEPRRRSDFFGAFNLYVCV